MATVIDGDSVVVAGVELRLLGIDAPEGQQRCTVRGRAWRCGEAAAETLGFLVSDKPVRCTFDAQDRYDRGLATCFRDDMNLNAMLVELGMALVYRDQGERYRAAQRIAEAQRRGLWDAEFVPPWEWRRQQRVQAGATGNCAIKGNVNRRGEKIYHVRGSRHFTRVRIHPAEGDRCFESVSAATAAGFRAPRQ